MASVAFVTFWALGSGGLCLFFLVANASLFLVADILDTDSRIEKKYITSKEQDEQEQWRDQQAQQRQWQT